MKQRKISSIAIFLIGMGIMGCTSSEGYKIRGTIGDVQEGKVTLVTYNGKIRCPWRRLRTGNSRCKGVFPN